MTYRHRQPPTEVLAPRRGRAASRVWHLLGLALMAGCGGDSRDDEVARIAETKCSPALCDTAFEDPAARAACVDYFVADLNGYIRRERDAGTTWSCIDAQLAYDLCVSQRALDMCNRVDVVDLDDCAAQVAALAGACD